MPTYLDILAQALEPVIEDNNNNTVGSPEGAVNESVSNSIGSTPYTPLTSYQTAGKSAGNETPLPESVSFDPATDPDWWYRFLNGEPRPIGNWCDYSTLEVADLAYLTTPRRDAQRCPWCGRFNGHHTQETADRLGCPTLTPEWQIVMSFGKWKGKPIADIDSGYLKWLQRKIDAKAITLESRVREEVDRVLRERK